VSKVTKAKNGQFQIVIPEFPPSVNHYWTYQKTRGGRLYAFVANKGKWFRERAFAAVRSQRADHGLQDRLKVTIELNPPDRRRRDLDNFNKGVLDALTHAGVWADDSQIDELIIKRGKVVPGGETVVNIELMQIG
jgi:crossover junction endodeoxyribonuclease RusA